MERRVLQELEKVAAWAWPAFVVADVDGWLWRYSGGGSKRANSVLAMGWRGHDVERSIELVEKLYAERCAPPQFNVGSVSEPPELDRVLEARGYIAHEAVTTMAKAVGTGIRIPSDVVRAAQPSDGWMQTYTSVISASRKPQAPQLVSRVPSPRAFFSCVRGGQVVSCGLGVAKEAIAVVECMATRADARRAGGARSILDGIEAWAAEQGANLIFLQAVTANAPAIALYEGAGYAPVMQAHYRVLGAPT
jgi:ribosomal protein S18 acetylase RimI-like enzyme